MAHMHIRMQKSPGSHKNSRLYTETRPTLGVCAFDTTTMLRVTARRTRKGVCDRFPPTIRGQSV